MSIEQVLNLASRHGIKMNPMAALKNLDEKDRHSVNLSIRVAMEELGISYQEALRMMMEIGVVLAWKQENE